MLLYLFFDLNKNMAHVSKDQRKINRNTPEKFKMRGSENGNEKITEQILQINTRSRYLCQFDDTHLT